MSRLPACPDWGPNEPELTIDHALGVPSAIVFTGARLLASAAPRAVQARVCAPSERNRIDTGLFSARSACASVRASLG
jgi:hypothetical protein